MLDRFKHFWQSVMLAPFVNLFIRLGVSPDAVTLVGTLGVSAGALVFFPQGELLTGVLVITAFVFSDLVDGAMARATGRTSKFGAFFDSTLDRIGDGAIFGGLVLYFAGPSLAASAANDRFSSSWTMPNSTMPGVMTAVLPPGETRSRVARAERAPAGLELKVSSTMVNPPAPDDTD